MQKPKFVFSAYKNSFKVFVENLEKLSVEQIQEIEYFVTQRKGFFDFNTYTFTIQKRLEFEEFCELIKLLNLNAVVINNPPQEVQKKRVGFGQYKGMFYSELPDSYLLWLKSNYHGIDKEFIRKEIEKRKI